MMSIKDLDKWHGRNTLEDIIALGINPLLDLTRIIDNQLMEHGLDWEGELTTLNRLVNTGLRDMQESMETMWKNWPKEEKEAA